MNAVVVLSGGMDSAVALAQACLNFKKITKITAIHFDYGSKHAKQETICAEKLAKYYEVPYQLIKLPFISELFKSDLLLSGGEIPEGHYEDESMKRTVVPFRNGIMLSIAVGFAESIFADYVILGNHAGDHAIYPDCRAEFTKPFNEAALAGTGGKVEIYRPFERMTKAQIAEKGDFLEVPFDLTYSCYKGGQYHCGKCGTCTERREAFEVSKTRDPTEYLPF